VEEQKKQNKWAHELSAKSALMNKQANQASATNEVYKKE